MTNKPPKYGYSDWIQDGLQRQDLVDLCDFIRTKWNVGVHTCLTLKPGFWWWSRVYRIWVIKIGNEFPDTNTFGEYRFFDTFKEVEAEKALRSL